MNKFLKLIFNRVAITGLLILLQLGIILFWVLSLTNQFIYFYFFSLFLGLALVIYIIGRTDNPSYKLAWAIPILLLPIFGGFLYLIFGGSKARKRLRKRIEKSLKNVDKYYDDNEDIIKEIEGIDKSASNIIRYTKNSSGYPIYKNTSSKYFSSGEEFFPVFLEELEKANHFIFMEYFIIGEGLMWDSILEILKRKVSEGVDVRLIYDDFGCARTLPNNYSKKLESFGIMVHVFNQVMPVLSSVLNNRDHRKITVIDGKTAFTGGLNLADEYINEIERFGYWKDSAVILKGDAVWSFTTMFLKMWSVIDNRTIDYDKYLPFKPVNNVELNDGYVQVYGDSPYDGELIGESIYMSILNRAKDYVYIYTPYLIIDNEVLTSLTIAAKSGIDVRLVTPHIEDKWYVHIITKSYYAQLIEAGVKVYEYTPGFVHSKVFLSDDEIATVGTINLDYRSLYLHFECGTYLYKTESIKDIKKDFEETFKSCRRITLEDTKKIKWSNRFLRAIIRLVAPLL